MITKEFCDKFRWKPRNFSEFSEDFIITCSCKIPVNSLVLGSRSISFESEPSILFILAKSNALELDQDACPSNRLITGIRVDLWKCMKPEDSWFVRN